MSHVHQGRIRPPDGQAAIGIDLGTSSSLGAVWTSVTGSVPEVRLDVYGNVKDS